MADGLAAVPRDSLWWASLSFLADAAVILADRDAAATIYPELLPGRGLVVQVGNLLAAYGSVDRYLGALAALMGRDDDAAAHFETALEVDGRAGMPVWLTRTQVAYGRFLAPRDPDRATAMLDAAHASATALGLAVFEGKSPVSGDLPSKTAPAPAPAGLTEREVAILGLLVEGRTNREIGQVLHISQHTAANHVRSILMKTGCVNRTEAAAWALRQGLTARP